MQPKKQNCRIRIRNSVTDSKYKNRQVSLQLRTTKQLKKQLTGKLQPEICVIPTFKTDTLLNQRRIVVPPLSIDCIKDKLYRNNNPEKNNAGSHPRGETDKISNGRYSNDPKFTFRSKKVHYSHLTTKNNYSSVLSPKRSAPQFQEFKQNARLKTNYQLTQLAETSVSERNMIKKLKQEKCLIAGTKKLPFSLEKRHTKKKQTQKTHFTHSNQDLFDLDISIILDEHEGPATPFIRRGSEIDQTIYIA